MNKFYITTAIDYVNDTIHIGHAFQKIAADVIARYYRGKIGNENVYFLTGTDEYGQKAEKAAKEAGVSPKEFVDKISKSDQDQQDALNISYDRFIRTTDEDHTKAVQEIWKRVEKSGDIYLGEYEGLYCEGCEAYYTEDDLIDGHCPFHPNLQIKKVKEENYFFKWTNYRQYLIDLIKANQDFIIPRHRAKEMLDFVENVKDIPISRTNFSWGVPVPGDSKQVIYVWFDALTNYITGVGFPQDNEKFKKFWPADLHVLGKDNLRWHSLLWPAMLKSAGIEPPRSILVNGFLSLNGQKISKSLGNIIRPTDWVEKYGPDAVRYYLLSQTVVTEDSDISEEKLRNVYNADLANGLGNLVARVAKLCESSEFKNTGEGKIVSDNSEFEKTLGEYRFDEALKIVWKKIDALNKYVDENKPWELIKAQNIKHQTLGEILSHLVEGIQEIEVLLYPFLPETSQKIKKQFAETEIKSAPSLFPRI